MQFLKCDLFFFFTYSIKHIKRKILILVSYIDKKYLIEKYFMYFNIENI